MISMFHSAALDCSTDGSCETSHRDAEGCAEVLYRTFKEQSSDLYWLGYLLTGDSEQSLKAFTSALEFDGAPNPVFRGFIVSWARRLVVTSALATIAANLRASALRVEHAELRDLSDRASLPSPAWMSPHCLTKPELERALLAIDVFPRCALLLTIFEKLPIKDAALLLHSDEPLVRKAQARGLIDLTRNLALDRGWDGTS